MYVARQHGWQNRSDLSDTPTTSDQASERPTTAALLAQSHILVWLKDAVASPGVVQGGGRSFERRGGHIELREDCSSQCPADGPADAMQSTMCQRDPMPGRTRKGFEVERKIAGKDCQEGDGLVGLQSQYFTAMPRPLAFSTKSMGQNLSK